MMNFDLAMMTTVLEQVPRRAKRCRYTYTIFGYSRKKKTGVEDIQGEWPSGLRRFNKNQKVLGSKPARRSAGLRDPTSLRDSQWPSGRMWTNAVINIRLVRLSPWEWPKVGRGAAKEQLKKKSTFLKTSLEFLGFLLYQWKFQTKQGFTRRNSTKLCYTPWKF